MIMKTSKQMSVTVRVTDSRGLYATGVIEITIMDENDPPVLVSTKEYYLQENAAMGTEIGRIIADDPDDSRDNGKDSINLNIVYEDPNFLERGSHIASDEIAFSSDSIRNIFVDDMSKYWQTDQKNVSLFIDINKNLEIASIRLQWKDGFAPKDIVVAFSETLDVPSWSSKFSIVYGDNHTCMTGNDSILYTPLGGQRAS